MGHDNQVLGNEIDHQNRTGGGSVRFPQKRSQYHRKQHKFAALEGLSIDLNSQPNLGVSDFQRGDGANPKRDSGNRRLDTGNDAINSPEFAARTFAPTGNSVTLQGKADPGSEVTIYRLGDYQQGKNAVYDLGYGALATPLTTMPRLTRRGTLT